MCNINGRAEGSRDLQEEAGLMCTAWKRAAHSVISLTVPCAGVILGDENKAAVKHNDWRWPWAVLFSSTFQSAQSLLVAGMYLYSMPVKTVTAKSKLSI